MLRERARRRVERRPLGVGPRCRNLLQPLEHVIGHGLQSTGSSIALSRFLASCRCQETVFSLHAITRAASA